MKWFSLPTYKRHEEDIKCYTRGVGRYYEWVIRLANQFNREYASIGILDVNDLIQAGHEGLIKAWSAVDWDMIAESTEPDAQLWNFIKKRIKWGIRREIDNHSTHIKVPRRVLTEMRTNMKFEDQIFVDLFPQFFDAQFPAMIEEIHPWDSLRLGELIDDYLYANVKNADHVEILRASYGIDRDKPMSIKELATKYRMSEIGIKKAKSRLIEKLKADEEFEKIIENFYEN